MRASNWTVERMLELGRRHADLEARRELEPLMATLVADPVYEFHPLGLRLSGRERVQRYYRQFFDDFMQRIAGYELLEEWANKTSVAQEYDIAVTVNGRPETHRVVGILYVAPGTGLLGGERIYAGEATVRLFTGPIFGELEPL